MLREEQPVYIGHIREEGYLLTAYCNVNAKPGDVEIHYYNSITCHYYATQSTASVSEYPRESILCIADDISTCFAYAREHNLNILRAACYSHRFWCDTMDELEKEIKDYACENNLKY